MTLAGVVSERQISRGEMREERRVDFVIGVEREGRGWDGVGWDGMGWGEEGGAGFYENGTEWNGMGRVCPGVEIYEISVEFTNC